MKNEQIVSPAGRVLVIWHGALYASYRKPFWALQQDHGWDIHLLTARRWGQAMTQTTRFEPADDEPISVYPRLAWPGIHGALFLQPAFLTLFERLRPDLLYIIEEPFSLMGWFAAYWSQRCAPPVPYVLYTYQDLYKHYPQPFCAMERMTLGYASRVLAPHSLAGRVVEQKGYQGLWDVVPQSVNLERFQYQEPHAATLFTLGYVGRLVEEKGIDTLLWALSEMNASVRLRLVGDGPAKSRLQVLARELGVDDQIVFMPPMPHESLEAFYHEIDALVLPSRTTDRWQEQFGRVLIEAMACGTPVIGSDCGAIPEVIGEQGLVFAQNNSGQLAEQIELLANDQSLQRRFSLHGRVRVEQNFSAQKVARKLDQHFREVLDHARRA